MGHGWGSCPADSIVWFSYSVKCLKDRGAHARMDQCTARSSVFGGVRDEEKVRTPETRSETAARATCACGRVDHVMSDLRRFLSTRFPPTHHEDLLHDETQIGLLRSDWQGCP